jgi:glycosyltransferase involved in cell wall biosynthesis
MQVKLSVVIITYNEQRNIQRCIQAIQPIADDIVIVDSFSTDDTVSIAQSLGARVVSNKFIGHIEQKNYAITKALYPHIFSVDADEMPDSVLLNQVQIVKQNWTHDGYTHQSVK